MVARIDDISEATDATTFTTRAFTHTFSSGASLWQLGIPTHGAFDGTTDAVDIASMSDGTDDEFDNFHFGKNIESFAVGEDGKTSPGNPLKLRLLPDITSEYYIIIDY